MGGAGNTRLLGARCVLPVVVTVLVGLAHGVTLFVPFQFDDLHQIANNPALRDRASIGAVFTDPWIGSSLGNVGFYRPLLFLTFLSDGLLGGGSPVPYRITSLVLLVAFSLIAGRFVRVLLGNLRDVPREQVARIGQLVAMLVAVHPILNESVLMASSRSSLLMGVFGLVALTAVVQRPESPRAICVVVMWTIFALLTKETAVVLGLLAPLTMLALPSQQSLVRRVWGAWPVMVPVAAYVIFYVAMRQTVWSASPEPAMLTSLRSGMPLADRPAHGLLSLVGLARLFFAPVDLSLVHEVVVDSAFLRWTGIVMWPIILTVGILLMRASGHWRSIGFVILWFVLALMPVLMAGLNSPMGEHRVVLAIVMPLAAIAWVASRRWTLLSTKVSVAAMVVLLGFGSLQQSLPWRTDLALWTHEVEQHPSSARALGFLANAHLSRKDFGSARKVIGRALKIAPHHVLNLATAAQVEMQSGDLVAAGQFSTRALALEPDYPPFLLLETERLALLGNVDHALPLARRATEVDPASSAAWNSLGNVLWMLGDQGALAAYQQALILDSDNMEAERNLDMARGRGPERRTTDNALN